MNPNIGTPAGRALLTHPVDRDLFGGLVKDAFNQLVAAVRRTTEADRDTARIHLIGLFGAVGNDDPRVQRARRDLASALF
jgi:putative thioredoxin